MAKGLPCDTASFISDAKTNKNSSSRETRGKGQEMNNKVKKFSAQFSKQNYSQKVEIIFPPFLTWRDKMGGWGMELEGE